jgi:hypothetical protein
LVAGIAGPDSFGAGHGEYLPQRLVLLGLVALIPAFDLGRDTLSGRIAISSLFLCLTFQSVLIWDYALYSDRTAGQIMNARDLVGQRQRVATLLNQIRSRFRANPVLHADCWLGIRTGNIIWSNYETRHYYFPVQFRGGIEQPRSYDLEWLAIHNSAKEMKACAELWDYLLTKHARSIDTVLVWKSSPELDAITEREFALVARRGDVRVYGRRGDRGESVTAAHTETSKTRDGATAHEPIGDGRVGNLCSSAQRHYSVFCFLSSKR